MGFFHHHDKTSPDISAAYQQQQQQQQQLGQPNASYLPPPQPGPYPFSTFSPPSDPSHLVFIIADLGKGHDALVSPNHSPSSAAYRIEYTQEGFQCIRPAVHRAAAAAVIAGSAVSRHHATSTAGKIRLEYP